MPVRICYREPEDNIRDGEFTAAEYRDAWVHLSNLAKTADNPAVSIPRCK
jgi:hypothetical protein